MRDLQVADAAFDTLDENSTLDEIRSVNVAYSEALDDVIDSADDLANVRSEPIEDAYNDLNQAIADILVTPRFGTRFFQLRTSSWLWITRTHSSSQA